MRFIMFLICCKAILPSDSREISTFRHEPFTAIRHNLVSEEELSEVALSTFIKRRDLDLARYIKPHLTSVIKEVASSPESDSDDNSPSPRRIIRTWVRQPESVSTTPRPELDEIVLKAVEKAFKEKEEELEHKKEKIEHMFSKKATACITATVSIIITLASTLSSTYSLKEEYKNCTK